MLSKAASASLATATAVCFCHDDTQHQRLMSLLRDFIELFFPRTCCLCGTPLVGDEKEVCSACMLDLPFALNAPDDNNFIERRYIGRLPIQSTTALLIFRRKNKTQQILHQIKYNGNEHLAILMGRQLGMHIAQSGRFDDVDILVPVPLHPRKQRRRGYNQSLLLCQGIAMVFPRPIMSDNLVRIRHTDTQTRKNRLQRLDNMKDVFHVVNPSAFGGKHLLLVDDVITTGATTEACWMAMKHIDSITLSIAALAVAGDT